jgi:hypothetical protein
MYLRFEISLKFALQNCNAYFFEKINDLNSFVVLVTQTI